MDRFELFILLGLVLLAPLSLAEGIVPAISHTITHLAEDFAIDLLVHIYIAGLILIIYGLYLFSKERNEKRK